MLKIYKKKWKIREGMIEICISIVFNFTICTIINLVYKLLENNCGISVQVISTSINKSQTKTQKKMQTIKVHLKHTESI